MPNAVVTEAIKLASSGKDLTSDQAREVLAEIMTGGVEEAQTAAFLIALRTKGETVDEVAGLASTMRELAVRVEMADDDLLDTAGTGGGTPTFNVSTTAAFIAAGAGCRVAKHGNRSATSQCGSADLLVALGARIDLTPEAVARCIEDVGFGFMFAPHHHQATKHVVPVRKALGVQTIFNFLGPLTNPAGASRQLIGVSDVRYMEVMAGALVQLGCRRAMVVCGEDGMDEISVLGKTRVVEVTPDGTRSYAIVPAELGLEQMDPEALAGGTPDACAQIVRALFDGDTGARRSLAAVNAGAALLVAGRAADLAEGVRLAEQAIDSGAARDVVERFVAMTNDLSEGRR